MKSNVVCKSCYLSENQELSLSPYLGGRWWKEGRQWGQWLFKLVTVENQERKPYYSKDQHSVAPCSFIEKVYDQCCGESKRLSLYITRCQLCFQMTIIVC